MNTDNTQSLTRRYILALSTIAMLAILGQVIIQLALSQQQSDSRVINIAGRQRMLSQRLSKSALEVQIADSPQALSEARAELEDTLNLWITSHIGLQEGDDELGLPANNSDVVIRLFTNIEPQFQAMRTATQCIVDEDCGGTTTEYVATILENEATFLTGMDAIVFQYDDEASQRVQFLSSIEITLLALTLVVLVMEARLIFRPAIQRIEAILVDLLQTQTDLQEQVVVVEKARNEAEKANRVKSAFLASMSHELRTPLNAIINFTKFVAQGDLGSVNEEQSETLFEVVDSAKHLLSLINDVLDMSKIESGSLNLFIQDNMDLSEVIEESMSLTRALIMNKDVQMIATIPPGLPTLKMDRQRIRQVLLNILSNACKFTDTGTIHVRVTQETDVLQVAIEDTGSGIEAENLDKVFEAFQQTNSGIGQGGGTGLGMPITRSLVEAHGGKIWLTSELDIGTTFYFTLPLCPILVYTLIRGKYAV